MTNRHISDAEHAVNAARYPWMYPNPLAFAVPQRLPVDSYAARWHESFAYAQAHGFPAPGVFAEMATFRGGML